MQGQDGTPFLSFYDKTHALSFVWDGTQGDWIDVSFGGYSEPVIARIPWTPSIRAEWGEPSLKGFASVCQDFIATLHLMEEVTVGHAARCSSDDPNNHQGATCPIHEDASLIEARVR